MPGDIRRRYYWHLVGRAQLNIYSAQGSPQLRVMWPQMSTVWKSPGTKKPARLRKGPLFYNTVKQQAENSVQLPLGKSLARVLEGRMEFQRKPGVCPTLCPHPQLTAKATCSHSLSLCWQTCRLREEPLALLSPPQDGGQHRQGAP